MRPAPWTTVLRLTAALLPIAACGGSARPLQPVYSTEQLNAAAQRSLPDDDLPARASSDASPAPTPEPAPAPEPEPAGLRVIHASPDRAAASVALFLDGSEVPAADGVAYRAITGAVRLTPGDHAYSLRGATGARAVLLSGQTGELTSGTSTAIVHGLATGPVRLAVAVSHDSPTQPDAGKASVRFFHALVGLGAVDVCTVAAPSRPTQAVFANVAYGAFASVGENHDAYANVPSGAPLALQIRAQNARPCTGPVRGTVRLTPTDRSVVTAVAIGRVAGAPPAPRQLLVCTDAPVDGAPTCTPVAIQ